jgi:hypothetical protein
MAWENVLPAFRLSLVNPPLSGANFGREPPTISNIPRRKPPPAPAVSTYVAGPRAFGGATQFSTRKSPLCRLHAPARGRGQWNSKEVLKTRQIRANSRKAAHKGRLSPLIGRLTPRKGPPSRYCPGKTRFLGKRPSEEFLTRVYRLRTPRSPSRPNAFDGPKRRLTAPAAGRPLIPACERAEERVELRVPTDTKAAWVEAAERAGQTFTAWVRDRLDKAAKREARQN